MEPITIQLDTLRALLAAVFEHARADRDVAASAAAALTAAEADGLPSHGASRAPFYADQLLSGKIDGQATPQLERGTGATAVVDARDGFAFPALDSAVAVADDLARANGVAAVAVRNSHHAGVLAHPVERLAESGLVAVAFSNTPAGIAPWGGATGRFGTNPIAFACPRDGGPPLVVDLSLSTVARGKVMLAARHGESIPEGWALDLEGHPTTDAKAALGGTMVPIGGAKGAGLAMMVEILAGALTGSSLAFEAASFFSPDGPPPRVGQLLIALDPGALAGPTFAARVATLAAAMLDEPGVRLPGSRRLAHRERAVAGGIDLDAVLHAELCARAER